MGGLISFLPLFFLVGLNLFYLNHELFPLWYLYGKWGPWKEESDKKKVEYFVQGTQENLKVHVIC